MTILILDGAGFIGSALARALDARGVEVAAASRSGGGPHGVALDRRDVAQVRAAARARRVSAVIDLLAFTEADTLPLLAAMDGEVGRWVMASSCDVYRNYEGLHRTAAPEPLPGSLLETSPLRTTRHPYRTEPRRAMDAADAWMDDYDKIPLETALQALPGLGGAVLRLPMVFGPGDRQRRFRWIIAPMAAGKPQITVDPAWAAWRTSYGYVDDVADALATAALHPAAAAQVFNIGEAEAPDHAAWIRRFAGALDWDGEIVRAPAPAASPLAALDLRYTMACDSRAYRQACGWSEPTLLAEALARTAADEMSRG